MRQDVNAVQTDQNRKTSHASRTKTLTMLAVLCAIAYVVMLFGRVPIISFLKYDPKDVIITMGGFLFGPMAAVCISGVVSVIEMFTVSGTGPIGMIMNILSTCGFACTAALIYKRNHTLKGAILGLLVGWAMMVGLMMVWNYLITPLYMNVPREEVAQMLIPMFLPFNLLKGGLNAALTMLLYKPLVRALRRAHLVPAPQNTAGQASVRMSRGVMLIAFVLLITCILFVLAFTGTI